jgi:hypothetical protein
MTLWSVHALREDPLAVLVVHLCRCAVCVISQVRDRLVSVLHDADVPPATIFTFVSHLMQHPDKGTITASDAAVVRYYSTWKEKEKKPGERLCAHTPGIRLPSRALSLSLSLSLVPCLSSP